LSKRIFKTRSKLRDLGPHSGVVEN